MKLGLLLVIAEGVIEGPNDGMLVELLLGTNDGNVEIYLLGFDDGREVIFL